jgi:hypothetical protein
MGKIKSRHNIKKNTKLEHLIKMGSSFDLRYIILKTPKLCKPLTARTGNVKQALYLRRLNA